MTLSTTKAMIFQKLKPVRSKKLRNSAKGQDCTINIPGRCSYDTEKTMLCHFPDDSGTGVMGSKSDDTCAGFGCHECHTLMDNRNLFYKAGFTEADYWYFVHRSMVRTLRKWVEMELIKLP